MCFILQDILSARIISRFTDSNLFIILTGVLFAFTPIMIFRMFGHTALAGHWIILYALETVFCNKLYHEGKKIYKIWAVSGLLAASTHIYFILICGIILIGYCIIDMISFRRIKRSLLVLMTYLTSISITIGLLGGFSGSGDAETGELGVYSFNLNAFFNPMGWSCIYQEMNLYGNGQYEGFAYLGAGFIFLLLFCAAAIAEYIAEKKISTGSKLISTVSGLMFMFTVSVLFALSPTITGGAWYFINLTFRQ